MKNSCRPFAATLAALSLATIASLPALAADSPGYHFLKEIHIGGDGGWDYLSIDPVGRRLYVSHATKVVVIDIDKDEIAGEIPDTPGVHGFAIAADLGRGFSSNGRENKVSIVDLKTLKTLSKVDTGENPDAILYEPGQQEVYTFNGRGQSSTVIDAKTGKVIATIKLPGKPEFATVDVKAGLIYNNIEDKSEVVVINVKTHTVVNTWPIAPGESASGMAIDTEHHRLFLGCDNKMMPMVDNTNGKVITSVPIGDGVDACAFDSATQLAFSSCNGTTTIAHEDSPDKLTVVQTLTTQPRARTMALDSKTHRIYLPTAKVEAGQEGARRPKLVPDSFKIVIYGKE